MPSPNNSEAEEASTDTKNTTKKVTRSSKRTKVSVKIPPKTSRIKKIVATTSNSQSSVELSNNSDADDTTTKNTGCSRASKSSPAAQSVSTRGRGKSGSGRGKSGGKRGKSETARGKSDKGKVRGRGTAGKVQRRSFHYWAKAPMTSAELAASGIEIPKKRKASGRGGGRGFYWASRVSPKTRAAELAVANLYDSD